jgi:DNA-binding transcriptional LysR family regulator
MPDVRAVNLNLLLVFDELLATRSVTRAGERLGLTQSGTSNALAQLRGLLDDQLFERHGRTMRPTPRALALAADVHAGVEAFRRALAPQEFDPGRLDRAFHLAMPDAVQRVVLPPLLRRLSTGAPGVRVHVRTLTEQVVPDGLARGDLDLFAGFVSAVPDDHNSVPLYDDAYVCILRSGHPALVRGAVALDRWLEAGHIVIGTAPSGPTEVDRALGDRGLHRQVAVRVENALLVPPLVAATDLVALIDRSWGEQIPLPGVVLAEPPIRFPRGRVRLVWHRRLEHDPATCWLRDLILDPVGGAGLLQRRSRRSRPAT